MQMKKEEKFAREVAHILCRQTYEIYKNFKWVQEYLQHSSFPILFQVFLISAHNMQFFIPTCEVKHKYLHRVQTKLPRSMSFRQVIHLLDANQESVGSYNDLQTNVRLGSSYRSTRGMLISDGPDVRQVGRSPDIGVIQTVPRIIRLETATNSILHLSHLTQAKLRDSTLQTTKCILTPY
jgi:hypothetical protein